LFKLKVVPQSTHLALWENYNPIYFNMTIKCPCPSCLCVMQRFINENNAKACMSKNHTKGVHSSLKSDKLVYLIFSSTHCPVFSLLLQSCYVLLWEMFLFIRIFSPFLFIYF